MPVLINTVRTTRIITLSNRAKRNAFTPDMLTDLATAIHAADRDSQARVIVLTGDDGAFCAGGDVSGMGGPVDASERLKHLTTEIHPVVKSLVAASKPTIAMINGAAVGAGLDIALACDFRYCAADAVLREAYILVGLAAGDGGAWLLPRLVGLSTALDLLLTGRRVTAAEAKALRLVNEVCEPAQLRAATLAFADELASRPPNAQAAMKKLVYQSLSQPLDIGLQLAADAVAILQASSEHSDAIRATS